MKLILASGNPGKAAEIRSLLRGSSFVVDDLTSYPEFAMPEETGSSYRENAWIKAAQAAKLTGEMALADDSGIEVAALNWGPGLFSSRWAGAGLDAAGINQRLLEALEGIRGEGRKAVMRCAVAIALPGRPEGWFGEGSLKGEIALSPAGRGGFGYDPIFYLPGYGGTLAQLPMEVREMLSHRGKAVRAILPILEELKK